ncbi:hypothetical protein HK100_001564 [Physocladia obscura]|uniref:UBA domain-containing protein n=1 Tax=Physocladia obscura TaxID=109957 RepID=A0AAD5SWW6_9FUNG|nr:hypothetical protein HK100_001564 [Physocladia obscura]
MGYKSKYYGTALFDITESDEDTDYNFNFCEADGDNSEDLFFEFDHNTLTNDLSMVPFDATLKVSQILGANYPKKSIIQALLKFGFDAEMAINSLLDGNKIREFSFDYSEYEINRCLQLRNGSTSTYYFNFEAPNTTNSTAVPVINTAEAITIPLEPNVMLQTIIPTEIIQDIFSQLHPSTISQYHRFGHLGEAFETTVLRWPNSHVELMAELSLTQGNLELRNIAKPVRISQAITKMTGLGIFKGKSAQLLGSIPSRIGRLLSLTILDLSDNNLTGTIPGSIGDLKNLIELNLCRNNLEGCIRPEFGRLFRLQALNISQNCLSGSIPASLGSMTEIMYLNLGYNDLEGEIPESLGQLQKLTELLCHVIRLSIANTTLSVNPDVCEGEKWVRWQTSRVRCRCFTNFIRGFDIPIWNNDDDDWIDHFDLFD